MNINENLLPTATRSYFWDFSLNDIPEPIPAFPIASQNWIDTSLCAGNLSVFAAWVWQQCSQPCADNTKSPQFLRIRDSLSCNEKSLSLWKNVTIQLCIKFFSRQVTRSHSIYIMWVLQSEGWVRYWLKRWSPSLDEMQPRPFVFICSPRISW